MTSQASLLTLLLVLFLGVAPQPAGQNADLAMKIANARKQNAALMQQYSWTSRTELMEGETVRDIRLESVTFGPDGNPQRSLINDEGSPLPRGFLRRRIAEHKKKELEKYLTGLRGVLDQYTLPSAGKILDFINSAKIDGMTGADGTPLLQLTGSGVVSPGDSLVMEVNPATSVTRRMVITTTFEGSQVTATATFKTTKSGLTHMAFAEVEVPDKTMSLQVHNFDYESSQ